MLLSFFVIFFFFFFFLFSFLNSSPPLGDLRNDSLLLYALVLVLFQPPSLPPIFVRALPPRFFPNTSYLRRFYPHSKIFFSLLICGAQIAYPLWINFVPSFFFLPLPLKCCMATSPSNPNAPETGETTGSTSCLYTCLVHTPHTPFPN